MKWSKMPANAYSMDEIGELLEKRKFKHIVLYFMLLSHFDSLRLKSEDKNVISINIDEWAARFRQKRTTFSIMLRELVAVTRINIVRWNENSSRIVLDLSRSCFQPIESNDKFDSLERENKKERERETSPDGEIPFLKKLKEKDEAKRAEEKKLRREAGIKDE